MNRELLAVVGTTLLGALGVSCEANPAKHPAQLPLSQAPNTSISSELGYPAGELPTLPRPIDVPPPLSTPTPAPPTPYAEMDKYLPRPRVAREVTPQPEIIPQVEPNDIIGETVTTEPTRLVDGTIVPEKTLLSVILKPNGARLYLARQAAGIYFERGAIIPHWLSPDTQKKYIVTADGKWVRGGPVNAPEGTYMPIRHYDLSGVGGFSGPPAVGLDGYVVTPKNGDELDVGERWPHHGGTFWKAPKGWKILKAVFGTAERRGDLLLTLAYGNGETGLHWLVRAIPKFPQWVKDACGSATHELTHCMMEYIRDEKSKQRDINQKIEFVHVPESSGIFDAVVIWNPYP